MSASIYVEGGGGRDLRTRCRKAYHKGRHSFALLALIDPTRVEEASSAGRRFLEAMRANCA